MEMEMIVSPTKKLKILSEKQNIQIETKKKIEKLEQLEQCEPLLQETPNQYVIFPIKNQDMWQDYKELVEHFWSMSDLNLDSFMLSESEKKFLKSFASIYASPESHGLVIENFAENFAKLIQITEAKFFYGHVLLVQNIHYELYNQLLEKLTKNETEKLQLYRLAEAKNAIVNKRKWCKQWQNSSFEHQLVASACMRGLFFTSHHAIYNWLTNRSRSILSRDLQEIFHKTIFDQELFLDFDCLMISHLINKPTKEFIMDMINQATKIEFDFLNEIKLDLIDYNSQDDLINLLNTQVKLVQSRLLDCVNGKSLARNKTQNMKIKIDSIRKDSQNYHQQLRLDDDF